MPTALEQVAIWHAEWQASGSDKPHWADHINWTTAEAIAIRLDELTPGAPPESCPKARAGWYCVLDKGHDGPCADYLDD